MKLKKDEWEVKPTHISMGKELIKEYHYAKGGSLTCVFMHGLYNKTTGKLHGVAQWLPPIVGAAKSVTKDDWRKVLSLSRLVITPDTPKNACSFLLSKSIKLIKKDGRYTTLLTYADEAQGHIGTIYKASNWEYVGKTGPYTRWIEISTGRQVSKKQTYNLSTDDMKACGYKKDGRYYKHKYVLRL